jgi:hypothetical protein
MRSLRDWTFVNALTHVRKTLVSLFSKVSQGYRDDTLGLSWVVSLAESGSLSELPLFEGRGLGPLMPSAEEPLGPRAKPFLGSLLTEKESDSSSMRSAAEGGTMVGTAMGGWGDRGISS